MLVETVPRARNVDPCLKAWLSSLKAWLSSLSPVAFPDPIDRSTLHTGPPVLEKQQTIHAPE